MRARTTVCSVMIVAAFVGCSDSDDDDAAARDSGASQADDGGAMVHGRTTQDSGPEIDTTVRLQRETEFWDEITICGEAVEQYATVGEMAEKADAVVLGRIVDASAGNTVQGTDPLDFYAEVDLRIEVDEILRGTTAGTFDLSLILTRVITREALESTIEDLQSTLPQDSVLLFLRRRTDLDHSLYRLVNDKGLWARTARSDLDSPVVESCHWDESERDAFLGDEVHSLDELVELLRN